MPGLEDLLWPYHEGLYEELIDKHIAKIMLKWRKAVKEQTAEQRAMKAREIRNIQTRLQDRD